MARFFVPQKELPGSGGSGKSTSAMLTVLSQQCGMTTRRGAKALAIMLEDANGRQEQRSGRDMAEHGSARWRRVSNSFANKRDGVARNSARSSIRWAGATAGAQKQLGELMEKYLVSMKPAEPGADGQHGRAVLQSIEWAV